MKFGHPVGSQSALNDLLTFSESLTISEVIRQKPVRTWNLTFFSFC